MWLCSPCCTRPPMPVARDLPGPIPAPASPCLQTLRSRRKNFAGCKSFAVLYLPVLAHPSLSCCYSIFSSQPHEALGKAALLGREPFPSLSQELCGCGCWQERPGQALAIHWLPNAGGKVKRSARLLQTQQRGGEAPREGGWRQSSVQGRGHLGWKALMDAGAGMALFLGSGKSRVVPLGNARTLLLHGFCMH